MGYPPLPKPVVPELVNGTLNGALSKATMNVLAAAALEYQDEVTLSWMPAGGEPPRR